MPKEKADKVKGAIFWHSQDEQDYQKNGRLSLAYGDLDTEQHGNIGLPTVETGRILATELQKEGLRVNWNGDASQRIEVLP